MSATKEALLAAAELLNMAPDELLTKLDPPAGVGETHLDDASRFWLLTPDPEAPEHPTSLGSGWCGVVDEEAGGVVAWTHESNAAAVVRGLAGGDR